MFANNEGQINRIQLLVKGRQDTNLNFTPTTHPKLFSKRSLQFKHSFSLALEKDANIIVVTKGNKVPVNLNFTKDENTRSFVAISSPFFIDVDSNGFVSNKDTLGEPLPIFEETSNQMIF